MDAQIEITADAVRQNLIKRARAFLRDAARPACPRSARPQSAMTGFWPASIDGGNFTLDTYQRVIDWLDAAEASAKDAA
jgi:hypothetical protein